MRARWKKIGQKNSQTKAKMSYWQKATTAEKLGQNLTIPPASSLLPFIGASVACNLV
jgi:hypothetical protein